MSSENLKQYQNTTRLIEECQRVIDYNQENINALIPKRDKALVGYLKETDEDRDLTVEQAALFLGIEPQSVRGLISKRKLPATKFGKEKRIASQDCRAYLEKAASAALRSEEAKRDIEYVRYIKTTDQNPLFTTTQAAIYMGIEQSVIWNATKYGTLEHIKAGRYTFIQREHCDKFMEWKRHTIAAE